MAAPGNIGPGDMAGIPDPRFLTPLHQIYDMRARLAAVRLYGTKAVFGPRPSFYNSDDYPQEAPEGPAEGGNFQHEVDPWGRPRETLVRRDDDPFIDHNVAQAEADDRRATNFVEFPQFGNFGPYFRKFNTRNEPAGKNIAPKNIDGRYDITTFIDEELKKDPCALDDKLDDWRREVEFQFGEKPPPPPPNLGPAPSPGEASYDFSSLSILFKDGDIRPLLVPHPQIRSPLAPQRCTDAEMDADYDRINSLPIELCSSWWVGNILWFMGENDMSLAKTLGMVLENSCPHDVFPFRVDPTTYAISEEYLYESAPLILYEPLQVVDGRPDPIENSIWVPKLKGVDGSMVRFVRPPLADACILDTRYFPVPALQSTVLPARHDIGRPELKLWDGIPGHTFRLPPHFWPDELNPTHLDGDNRPFAIDIRRIPVKPKPGTVHPQPKLTFRPTRRLNTVYRDRAKVPQNDKRSYNPEADTPIPHSPPGNGPNILGGNGGDDNPPKSFLQDEFEYDTTGDVWGPVGGYEGRDYDSERQRDHDRWYRYFLINNDPLERIIIVNGVYVKPGAVAGPLPAFAMLELGGQAAFWFGVGGRDYDPNTTTPPEKRMAEEEPPGYGNRVKIARHSPSQEAMSKWTLTPPQQAPQWGTFQSPVGAAISRFQNLHLGQTLSQPAGQASLRGNAPEFVPGSLGGLERLGLRGGAGTEADLDPVGSGGGTAPPAAKQAATGVIGGGTQSVEEEMEERGRQLALQYAAAGEQLRAAAPQQNNTGTQQNTSTGTPNNNGPLTPYQFTTVTLQPRIAGTRQYLNYETAPYMSTGALEGRMERLGICVDPSWDRAKLLDELLKVKIPHYPSAQEVERANNQAGGGVAERGARARAERMIAAVSESSELEQRHICEGLGIIISPQWSQARIREEIARLYETAYQELMSNNNAAAEYEEAMELPANSIESEEPPNEVKVLFFLASRYMYRQRSGAGLKALCEKYCIEVHQTWDAERIIIEIIRAVDWQRQIGIARAAACKASIAASIAAIGAMDDETALIRATMAEMAKAKAGQTVIDLTNTRTVIDLTDCPPRIDALHGQAPIDLTDSP
ncbi:hypothetical protein ACLOAV_002121 [Pseudogymnoascus australis]